MAQPSSSLTSTTGSKPDSSYRAASSGPAPRTTLLKLGVNVSPVGLNDYWGVLLPVTLGLERQLNPRFSVYGNLNTGWQVRSRRQTYGLPGSDYRRPLVPDVGLAAGARYYYNQAERLRRGRAAGPLVGNYLALEGRLDFEARRVSYAQYSRFLYEDQPGVAALWGMQRRLGKHFLFDFNTGVRMQSTKQYWHDGLPFRQLEFRPELNLRLGLGL